ncbi:hypothetical protein DFJ63DRAFT_310718 [Scheffersomyces coipomensis]|uniref:uncharacterized protein n=1 Tax=Scheffersomyces coipomensis TaxID=1788519 RepID=UPI00315C8955
MSDIEYLGPPGFGDPSSSNTPTSSSSPSVSLSQRRTSNFFPTNNKTSDEYSEMLFTKHQLNSPIINVLPNNNNHNNHHHRRSTASSTTSVHTNNNNSGNGNGNGSSKFFSGPSTSSSSISIDPMTPFTSLNASLNTTPTIDNNMPLNHSNTRLTQSSIAVFGGIDFVSSPPPVNFNQSQSQFYYQQTPTTTTTTTRPSFSNSISSPQQQQPPPPKASSTSALGAALPSSNNSGTATTTTTTTRSTNSTPIANPWSIWNESPIGVSGNGNGSKQSPSNGNTPVLFDHSSSTTPKLSSLRDFINSDLMFQDVIEDDDDMDDIGPGSKYRNDLLFSPFLSGGGDQSQQFNPIHHPLQPPPQPQYVDFQYQSNTSHSNNNNNSNNYQGSNRTNSMSSSGTIKPKRENIYVNKTNIPQFIPSSFSPPVPIATMPTHAIPIEITQSERNLEDMRQLISKPRSNFGGMDEEVLSDSYLESNDENQLQLKLENLIKREEDMFRNSNNNSTNNNSSNIYQRKSINDGRIPINDNQASHSTTANNNNPGSINRNTVTLNLPRHYQSTEYDNEEEYDNSSFDDKLFINDILMSKVSNKYAEDYASTFYKRNSHGYMFIKEPTTTLKVNSTGNKSWVQLKIKLPPLTTNENLIQPLDTSLVAKKLKVDIKQLPLWRPINLNSSSASSSSSNYDGGSGSSSSSYSYHQGGNKRMDNGNGNGNGNGGGGSYVSSKKHDFRKPKNLNVSKRFGKRNSE